MGSGARSKNEGYMADVESRAKARRKEVVHERAAQRRTGGGEGGGGGGLWSAESTTHRCGTFLHHQHYLKIYQVPSLPTTVATRPRESTQSNVRIMNNRQSLSPPSIQAPSITRYHASAVAELAHDRSFADLAVPGSCVNHISSLASTPHLLLPFGCFRRRHLPSSFLAHFPIPHVEV